MKKGGRNGELAADSSKKENDAIREEGKKK